jgi:hypothetical protein
VVAKGFALRHGAGMSRAYKSACGCTESSSLVCPIGDVRERQLRARLRRSLALRLLTGKFVVPMWYWRRCC